MPTKSGAYVYLEDGSNANQVFVANQIDTNIQPIDIQSHLQTTIQTQSGVTVAPGTNSDSSSWIDTDGFDKLACTMINDAGTNAMIQLLWSNDGSSIHFYENLVATGTSQQKGAITETKSRYVKVRLNNSDTAPHIMSAWAYLKA